MRRAQRRPALGAPALQALEPGARRGHVGVEDRVLEAPAGAVGLLERRELLALALELGQARVEALEHLRHQRAPPLGLGQDAQRLAAPLLVDLGAADLLEELEPLVVAHRRHGGDLPLLDDVVGVGAREARGLEEGLHLGLGHGAAVDRVLVALEADRAAEAHLAAVYGEAVVRVVEDDLDVGLRDRVARPLVEQAGPVLGAQGREDVADDEADRVEEVGLARAVGAHWCDVF